VQHLHGGDRKRKEYNNQAGCPLDSLGWAVKIANEIGPIEKQEEVLPCFTA